MQMTRQIISWMKNQANRENKKMQGANRRYDLIPWAARLCYIGPHFTTDAREQLGAKLADIAPGDIDTAFFTGSGSEANEIAMTIARLVTGRRKIMTR